MSEIEQERMKALQLANAVMLRALKRLAKRPADYFTASDWRLIEDAIRKGGAK